MYLNEHKYIEKLLKNKIQTLKINSEKADTNEELQKYEKLLRLITNRFHTFFDKLNIEMAYMILLDIGVEQESLEKTYIGLINEERGESYILIDVGLDEDKDAK